MRRNLMTAAIAFALCAGVPTVSAQTPAEISRAARPPVLQATTQLPRNVRPTNYDIEVVPHAEKMAFDGKARINVEVLEPTRTITLNAVDLTFANVRLGRANGRDLVAATSIDAAAQTATFTFDEAVPVGSYLLSIEYTGRINTQANGLFALDYDSEAGSKRALFTQFEAPDARRFVPSWDEPNYKATFNLVATVPAAQMAVSNMPVAQSNDLPGGLRMVRFQTTPKMSTYLLFFALGEFERATDMVDGTEVGVVTTKGKVAQAAGALEASRLVLEDYNDYFGVDYPLPKLDNIAAPGGSQFFSAMENWGAILSFEHILLVDPKISTIGNVQGIFSVAAHEIAHQWFGNLVTMSWWDDLWLNEGFATWMAARATGKFHPEWNTRLNAVGGREGAMNRDAVATTHPVVQQVETVEQLGQAFDAITYQKGGAVIRMLEDYVGEDAWREGVRAYMKKHAYGNTVSNDLWSAVQAAAGKPIRDIARDFTTQPGIPLVTVESALCKGGKTTLQLSQGEFTRDRPGKAPLRWRVPVVAQVAGGARVDTVLDGKGRLEVPGCGAVVVNAGQAGYYRTLYGDAQFVAIGKDFAKLDPIDQLGIMNDTWALGMAGQRPASDYLELAKGVSVDADPAIWADIAGSLGSIDGYLKGHQAAQARFRAYARGVLQPVLGKIGWNARAGDSAPVQLLRTTLIGTLAGLEDAAVIAEARRRFAAGPDDAEAMPPALRSLVTAIVANKADAATWDALHAMAKAEKTPLIKNQLYELLGIAEDKALGQRALELALTDEPGATNSAGMIGAVAGQHPDMAFDFAVAHRAQVEKLVDASSQARYYPGIGGGSTDKAMIGKLRAFAEAHIPASARNATETAIANIEYRIKVRQERMPAIEAWLQQHGG
ncbi:MAG TPA: M1 family metallopeptidase [Thermomonas sp.]|nr:M1 family metallopeptidase [Thermomonas sp.]